MLTATDIENSKNKISYFTMLLHIDV